MRYARALFLVSISFQPALAQCEMGKAFDAPDDGGQTTIQVWHDTADKSLLFADSLAINTDGTSRSYSVGDFWGEKNAINNLCNAMSDACAGLDKDQLQKRRLLTQNSKAQGWPSDLLKETKLSKDIIPQDAEGRPCENGGYLVSATALHRPNIVDRCDQSNYADALTIPSIVLPKRTKATPTGFQIRGASIGDLALVMSVDGAVVKYAVVGDSGPSLSLGEISVALAAELLGKTEPPVNYKEIRGRGPFKGKGWNVGRTFVLVFPRTQNTADPYMEKTRIETEAKAAFMAWGGPNRLKACIRAYDAG